MKTSHAVIIDELAQPDLWQSDEDYEDYEDFEDSRARLRRRLRPLGYRSVVATGDQLGDSS
jgi:hypothetical protein